MNNGDIMRTMNNGELARIIARATFKHTKRAVSEWEIKREEVYWLKWLNEERK